MLYREIIAVCSQIHTKDINTLCGQNVELLNVSFQTFRSAKLNSLFLWTFQSVSASFLSDVSMSHSGLILKSFWPNKYSLFNTGTDGASQKHKDPQCFAVKPGVAHSNRRALIEPYDIHLVLHIRHL